MKKKSKTIAGFVQSLQNKGDSDWPAVLSPREASYLLWLCVDAATTQDDLLALVRCAGRDIEPGAYRNVVINAVADRAGALGIEPPPIAA